MGNSCAKKTILQVDDGVSRPEPRKSASPRRSQHSNVSRMNRSFSTMYKAMKVPYREELKKLGAYPVENIWEFFEKGEVLGKGGYGEVVIVTRKPFNSQKMPFDIKEIPPNGQKYAMKSVAHVRKEKPSFPAFENEVRIHKKLISSHIVGFKACLVSPQYYHIITEICTGGEVFDRIVAHKRFSENVASHIVRQMLLSLEHCHACNVVHRDLKPSNFVFATREGSIFDQHVKLIDFGLAKEVQPETVYSEKVGTPFYVSPETIDSNHPMHNARTGEILKAADMWAMGTIVFVLITGKLPFPGRKHKDIFKNITRCKYKFHDSLLVSDLVKDFIGGLLQLDPSKRMTCSEALQHPWIAKREEVPENPLDELVTQGIRQLQSHSKLQKAVARVAVNHLTDKDIANLQDLFANYDKDRSGSIEISELINLLKDTGFDAEAAEQEALQLMDDLDTNRDGALSIVEFAQVAARPRLSISRTMVKRTFESMDLDGDGMITPLEMKESLGDLIDDAYIEKIFRQADTNKDGMLTFEEFLEAMKMTVRTRRQKEKPQRRSVFELNFSADPDAPPVHQPSPKHPQLSPNRKHLNTVESHGYTQIPPS